MHALYIYNIRVYRVFLDILAIVHDYFHVSGIWEGGGELLKMGRGKASAVGVVTLRSRTYLPVVYASCYALSVQHIRRNDQKVFVTSAHLFQSGIWLPTYSLHIILLPYTIYSILHSWAQLT